MSNSFNRTPGVYAKDSFCITLPDHQNGHPRALSPGQSQKHNLPGFMLTLMFIAAAFLIDVNTSKAQSAIYGGGPIYKNRSYSINELKNSGFTHVIVWTIHIDASGNFNFNAEFPLISNGAYVGGSSYPNF